MIRDISTPLRAIRSSCLECMGYNESGIRECIAEGCPLWPYRMGRGPDEGHESSVRDNWTCRDEEYK